MGPGFNRARHERSWEAVHAWINHNLKVWSSKPEQSPLPTLLPWLEERFEDMTYLRVTNEEGYILFCNLTTMGVVSSLKQSYILGLITSFLTARPVNAIAVVLHANRAAEARKS